MYELEYVRKRKRKKRIAIVGGISSVVIVSFAIISFLGRFVGTFTVSLETRNVDLTLLRKKDSEEYSSFIRVDTLAPFQEFSYNYFDRYADLDSEDTSCEYGANVDENGKIQSLNFFKLTCYLKNLGQESAKYDWTLKIVDDVLSNDGRSLLDTVRIMVFTDGAPKVFGKALSEPIMVEGEEVFIPPISGNYGTSDFSDFVDFTFESSKVAATFPEQTIDAGQIKRYTIVAWLEGFRSSDEEFAPRGAKIKLGVDINAYENK